MNSNSVVSEIISHADIVQIISDYVTLKKAGKGFKGLCPFHSEKTPSFNVNPEKQMYHCFGCGAGGNVITFISKIENIPSRDAVRQLADRFGIRLSFKDTSENDEVFRQRKKMAEAYSLACAYYHDALLKSPQAESARKYLFESRKLTKESVEQFQLGFSPVGGQELVKKCAENKIPPPLLESCGLAMEQGGVTVDRFRCRLMFPIWDAQGKVCGFSGRALLKGEEPKYINTPETPLFNKGKLLYAFHLARKSMAQSEAAILMEGYMDVIMSHQFGFSSSVASMGTALTPFQAKLLAQNAKKVFVAYDADMAGQEAALRSILLLLETGVDVMVLSLPQGFDPDTFLLKEGAGAFQSAISDARHYVEYQCDNLLKRYKLSDPAHKIKMLSELRPTLEKIGDFVLRYYFVQRVALRLEVDEQRLRDIVANQKKRLDEMLLGGDIRRAASQPVQPTQKHLDEMLLAGMLTNERIFQRAKDEILPSDFSLPAYQSLAQKLLQFENAPENMAVLMETLDDAEEREILSAISFRHEEALDEKTLFGCIAKLKELRILKEIRELQGEMEQRSKEGKTEEAKKMMLMVQEKEKQRRNLKISA